MRKDKVGGQQNVKEMSKGKRWKMAEKKRRRLGRNEGGNEKREGGRKGRVKTGKQVIH